MPVCLWAQRQLTVGYGYERLRIIASCLTRHCIAQGRLRYNGYGDSRPAAPNDSEENKRRNRRVEFVVLAN